MRILSKLSGVQRIPQVLSVYSIAGSQVEMLKEKGEWILRAQKRDRTQRSEAIL